MCSVFLLSLSLRFCCKTYTKYISIFLRNVISLAHELFIVGIFPIVDFEVVGTLSLAFHELFFNFIFFDKKVSFGVVSKGCYVHHTIQLLV